MREPSRTFGVVSFGRSFLISLTDHHSRIEVQGVIVELQLGEEPTEQISENTLVDSLGEFVEISLVCTMVRATFPPKQVT